VQHILQKYALPIVAFVFAFSIARIGMVALPMTTNLSWAVAYVCVIPFIAMRPNLYFSIARRNSIFILAGVFATTSALWSLMPALSAYFGLLFLLNLVVGAVIAERVGIVPVILFVFWFCLIIQVASLVLTFAHSNIAIDESGMVRGLYSTKNVLAMHACILYLTSLLLLLAKWRPLFSVSGIAIAAVCVVLSRSGTGIVMFAFVTSIALSCYLVAQRRPWTLAVVGLFLIVVSVLTAVVIISGFDLSDGILAAIGKDRTLTGRTLLWDKALEAFEARPWFGLGYLSYWYSPQTDASEIWVLTSQELYSFHNIYLDRLVDVGIVGLALFVGGIVVLLARCLRLLAADRSVTWAWCFTFICFLCALGLSEYPIFWNNEFQLLISIIAVATCKIRSESPPHEA
jgi:O-antigen ligase